MKKLVMVIVLARYGPNSAGHHFVVVRALIAGFLI